MDYELISDFPPEAGRLISNFPPEAGRLISDFPPEAGRLISDFYFSSFSAWLTLAIALIIKSFEAA